MTNDSHRNDSLNLATILDQIRGSITAEQSSRIERVVSDVTDMLGGDVLSSSMVAGLAERYRKDLVDKGVPSRTVANKVYRLNLLFRTATQKGVLAVRPQAQSDFPSIAEPVDKADCRRWRVYSQVTCAYFAAGHCYGTIDDSFGNWVIDYLKDHRKLAGAEIAYGDIVRFWTELVRKGILKPVSFPAFRELKRPRYGLPRRDWPTEAQRQYAKLEAEVLDPLGGTDDDATEYSSMRPSTLKRLEMEIGLLYYFELHVRSPKALSASLVELLENDDTVLGFLQWHRLEKSNGADAEMHRNILFSCAATLKRLAGDKNKSQKYCETASGLNPMRKRSPFTHLELDFDRLVKAARRAVEDAMVTWAAFQTSGDGSSVALRKVTEAYRDALLFAFLVCRPLRSANVISIRLGQHLRRDARSIWQIHFDASETKGRRVIDWGFPRVLVDALELFVNSVLPRFRGSGSRLLFPARCGRRMTSDRIWSIVAVQAKRLLDIEMRPHDFRRSVVSAYLVKYPGEVERMRALLGHRYVHTTIKSYVHIHCLHASRSAAAFVRSTCPGFVRLGREMAGAAKESM